MSILVDKNTRVICQGLGKAGEISHAVLPGDADTDTTTLQGNRGVGGD